MEMLETIRLAITDFLNFSLIDNAFLSIDLWSAIHFLTGMLLMFLIVLVGVKKFYWKYLLLLLLLVAYEIFEFTMYGILDSQFFNPETLANVFWDIKIGLWGGTLVIFLLWIKKMLKKL
tara:strand:- start:119 stop:475 length:357 start_codon:yes stop_codon:yes gene_type:complete